MVQQKMPKRKVLIMIIKDWYLNNWNNLKQRVENRLFDLYGILDLPIAMFNDIEAWINELFNLESLYSEQYTTIFIENEIYDFAMKNYLVYEKLKSFSEDGGFSEQNKEDIKNSYSVGGFDTDNQDLASGALRNDHSTLTKNKTSNLEILNQLKNVVLVEKNKLLNKIKECLVIIW